MSSVTMSTGRLRTASLVLALLCAGTLLCLRPTAVLAQEYEAMMPDTLQREIRKAESEYRKIMDSVSVAETERMSRAAAGAAAAELRELDAKVGQLVTQAEKLKVHADYLEELYAAKHRDYKSR